MPTTQPKPKLIAFHGDHKIKTKYLNRVLAHQKADQILQHYGYWKNGKGCAVGCTLHSNDHLIYEIELGIPAELGHLEDAFFEGMSRERSKTWPVEFLNAIRPGSDLSLVAPKFIVWSGSDPIVGIMRLAKNEEEKALVLWVVALYQSIIDGVKVEIEGWAHAMAWSWAVVRSWNRTWAEDGFCGARTWAAEADYKKRLCGFQCRMNGIQAQENNSPHSDFTVDNHAGIR